MANLGCIIGSFIADALNKINEKTMEPYRIIEIILLRSFHPCMDIGHFPRSTAFAWKASRVDCGRKVGTVEGRQDKIRIYGFLVPAMKTKENLGKN